MTHTSLYRNRVSCLLFADDIVLFGTNHRDLQDSLDALVSFCDESDLSVNMAKTKIVPFGSNPRFLRESWTMNYHIVEVTDSYKYLGTWLHWKLKFNIAMSYQSDAASKAMFTLLNKLRELKIIDVQIALKLFNSMVKPILLYNSEIWGV